MDPIIFNLSGGQLLFQFRRSQARVFVMHGRNRDVRESVTRFLRDLGVETIVLDEQASRGQTIIEKFEQYSKRVSLAVALLTPDDVGYPMDNPDQAKPRARQNVVFELGYFVGKLGRRKVLAIYEGEVEIPSDFNGVVFIGREDGEKWKIRLIQELDACGVSLPHRYEALLRG